MTTRQLDIAMVGAGYVGLVSAACFAELGNTVTCIDIDADKIASLKRGKTSIYEPDLGRMIKSNAASGRLHFTTAFDTAIGAADLVFIAVNTPSQCNEGSVDMSYTYNVARQIAGHLDGYTVIANKSTVPVGTARKIAHIIREANSDASFDVAANPEFLSEGSAVSDFTRPKRIIIGVESARAEALLRELYLPFQRYQTPLLITDLASAELIKHASNTFLATKISLVNEISALCEAAGANIDTVARGIGMDDRIGAKFMHAGPGYGGSCLPKDVRSMVHLAREHEVGHCIARAVIEANDAQMMRMVVKIRTALGGSEAGKTLGVLGLTFKAGTDDMREAQSLSILPPLMEEGARVQAHDPKGMSKARALLPDAVEYCDDIYDVCTGADAVLLLTEWDIYRELDFLRLQKIMNGKVLIDLRNIYDRSTVEALGFEYFCIGR